MPEANGDHPATRADVRALEAKMEGRLQKSEERMEGRIRESEQRIETVIQAALAQIKADFTAGLAQMKTELIESTQEFVRDSQTELLRGFEAFGGGFDIRMRKVQSDITNVDAGTDRRLLILERRMVEIEKRLQIPFPGTTPPPPGN